MNKSQFLSFLRKKLKHFPEKEIENALMYYDELISDKVLDGMSEEDAVKSLGDKDNVASLCMQEMIGENKLKNPFKSLMVLFSTIYSSLHIPMTILLTFVYGIFLIVWFAIIVALGAGTGIALVMGIASIFGYSALALALFYGGIALVLGGILSIFALLTTKYGIKCFRYINNSIARAYAKKNKERSL